MHLVYSLSRGIDCKKRLGKIMSFRDELKQLVNIAVADAFFSVERELSPMRSATSLSDWSSPVDRSNYKSN